MYNFIKDTWFPKLCMGCGRVGTFLCVRCVEKIEPVYHDYCLYCGKKQSGGETCERCQRRGGVDGVMSLYFYSDVLQQCIHQIKYSFVQEGIRDLFLSAPWPVQQKLSFFRDQNIEILPTPLHPSRQKLRGFNQSDGIARLLSTITDKPVISGLERIKNTSQLARTQHRVERHYAMKNAFVVSNRSLFDKKNILLVDDVITSGSTAKEIARTLKKSGATCVYVFTLCRA